MKMTGKMKKNVAALVTGFLAACMMTAQAALFYVDGDWSGTETGGTSTPYNTIAEAVTAANAVSGASSLYFASGNYRDVANGGFEDYSAGGGASGGGYNLTQAISIYGGYAGWQGGTTFDWTTRNPRSTTIELKSASSRAFSYTGSGTPVFDGLTFQNANTTGDGGAIAVPETYGRGLSLNNCLFTNNTTTGSGGAAYLRNQAQSLVTNCDFRGNSAGVDGGALIFHAQYADTSQIQNCTFTNNTATSYGGAARTSTSSGSPVIIGSVFAGNSAGKDGGGLYPDNLITIRQSDFHNNSAPLGGAAIGGHRGTYAVGRINIENSLIYGNTGSYAVQSEGGTAGTYTIDMVNCTVTGNPGGGVRASREYGDIPMRIRNSIIVSNGAYGVYQSEAAEVAVLGYNDVFGNATGDYYQAVADINSRSADPSFMNPALSNYRLLLGSVAIDNGISVAGITTDLQGWPRPLGLGFDMGAFESPEPAALSLFLFAGGWLLRRRRR